MALNEGKFAAAVARYEGTVVQAWLSDEDEKSLIHDLEAK
jgi:hypothetical protein